MDLDIAIKYYSNLADDCRRKASPERNDYMDLKDLAAEHGQLADWLNELKILREKVRTLLEKDKWIPVTERLPEDGERVFITYDKNIIRATWDEMRGYFYDTSAMALDKKFVSAWRPLPEPYTEEET